MYQHVITELDVNARECLYVGDGNSHELPGAKKLGMTTVWVDNGDEQYWQERFEPAGDHTIEDLADLIPLIDRLE